MASFYGHITFSSALGAAYGAAAIYQFNIDWGTGCLGAGLTAAGGMLPDLDSASGVPVREIFGLAAVLGPLLLLPRFGSLGLTPDQTLAVLMGLYLFIRYGISSFFKKLTVHRGMYHSIPAMFIAGLGVFLAYHNPDMMLRCYLAAGVMLGFLSHLVLDELCSVDFNGVVPTLNSFAGSALKFTSKSWPATLFTYSLLGGLGYLTWLDLQVPPGSARSTPVLSVPNLPLSINP